LTLTKLKLPYWRNREVFLSGATMKFPYSGATMKFPYRSGAMMLFPWWRNDAVSLVAQR
jgi:hypothetical protein